MAGQSSPGGGAVPPGMTLASVLFQETLGEENTPGIKLLSSAQETRERPVASGCCGAWGHPLGYLLESSSERQVSCNTLQNLGGRLLLTFVLG